MKEKKELILCSFYKKCKNYPKMCDHCKWNGAIDLGDYLVLETKDGRTIRYL